METWAVIIDWIGNDFGDSVIRLVQEDCRRAERSLVVFTLGSLSYNLDEPTLEQQLLPFLRSPVIDKVLLFSSQLVRNGGGEKLGRILSRAPSRPTLSLGGELPGVASLRVRHDAAFEALLDHLWEVHGYRRFAWVGGPVDNPDAVERKRLFTQSLQRRGSPLSPSLDFAGDFNLSTGREAAANLASRLGDLDVIVAANDSMAQGILQVLGDKVPVVGFDNHPTSPAAGLTTVDPELEVEVLHGLRCLESLPKEAAPPLEETVLGRLVVRSSCGCTHVPLPPVAAPPPFGGPSERTSLLFEAILESRDMGELASCLNRALPPEEVGYWKILAPEGRQSPRGTPLDFAPEAASARMDLVVHSLFREEELFGYFVHDFHNQNYALSEWLRINLCLTFQSWQRQSGSVQVQRLLQVEIDKFSRRQKEVETVLNSLPVWIAELDRRFQLRYTNLSLNTLLGWPTGGRRQTPFLSAVYSPDRGRVENRLIAAMKQARRTAVDFRFVGGGGRLVNVVGEIQPLAEDGSSNLSALFGSLHGGSGLRLVGLDIKPLIEGVLQPEDLMMKHFSFGAREKELIGLLASGLDTAQMAEAMEITESTVRVQLHHVYIKTGVSKKKELLDLLADYNSRAAASSSLTQVLLSRLFGS